MRIHTRLAAVSLAATLAGAGLAPAHEGHIHKVMGVVSAVHAGAKTLEVRTTAGKVETVAVGDATKYLKGAAAAAPGDVAKGIRVVVSYKVEGGKKTATEVRIGAAAASTAKTAPAAKPSPAPSAAPKS